MATKNTTQTKKKPRKRRKRKLPPYTAVYSGATPEDILEATRQQRELSILGHKDNGEALRLVRIEPQQLLDAGYRLAVGGDFRRHFWAVRDDQGFFTIDGKCVFCLKGNRGREKLKELVDKGFFNSSRLGHKDKL